MRAGRSIRAAALRSRRRNIAEIQKRALVLAIADGVVWGKLSQEEQQVYVTRAHQGMTYVAPVATSIKKRRRK